MTTQIAISNRVKAFCYENNITINYLAIISGIPRSTIKNVFCGKINNTSIIILKKICDGLDICLADFSILLN